jgi:flagellar hook protein FlgE
MSLKGTMNTAAQALNAQSQHLSNISTNIANVNTTAYKVQNTHFQTLLNHVTPGGGAGPKKFFTADTVDTREVSKQGFLQTTNRTLDLAINGRGFFVTNTETDGTGIWQYTRDGSLDGRSVRLTTDSDGDGQLDQATLLTTTSGGFLYGWQADADGNFNEVDDLTQLVPIQINSNEIFPARATTTIDLQANVSAGSPKRQTVGMPFVDAGGNSRTVTLGFTPITSQTNSYDLDLAAFDLSGNAVPTIVALADGSGNPIPLTVDPLTGLTQPPRIQFDGTGNIVVPASARLVLSIGDPTGNQLIRMDIRQMKSFNDNGDLTVFNINQDGYIQGRLKETYFNEDGVLVGSYTNQGLRELYKLPIAQFAAVNNLEAKSGNFFTQTREAGERRLLGLDSVQGIAQIFTGALESSNVDLADQFSKMIVTQRAYSSSATVLRTADEMMQQTRDLKR